MLCFCQLEETKGSISRTQATVELVQTSSAQTGAVVVSTAPDAHIAKDAYPCDNIVTAAALSVSSSGDANGLSTTMELRSQIMVKRSVKKFRKSVRYCALAMNIKANLLNSIIHSISF
jgi:hypothetical protein